MLNTKVAKSFLPLSAALLIGAAVISQPAHARPGHGPGHWQQMDENGDGVVSRDEAEASAKARFEKADGDGDGSVTQEEIKAAREAKRAERADARFEEADTNSDGVLSEDEAVGRALLRFDEVDTDGDGTISEDERKAARKQFKEKWKEMRQGR